MSSLIYVSRAKHDVQEKPALKQLAAISALRNSQAGLTGLLTYVNGHFMQLLEGPENALMDTFTRIRADQRHHNIDLLGFESVDKRHFGDWDMNFVEFKEPPEATQSRIESIRAMFESHPLTHCIDALEAFVAPGMVGRKKNEKTVVVCDSHIKCASFINWIADKSNAKSKRLAFTPSRTKDEQAIDYVDLPTEKNSRRIVGVEFALLSEALAQPVLRQPQSIVLLLTKTHTLAAAAELGALLCASVILDERPKVRLLGCGSGAEASAKNMARVLGTFGIAPKIQLLPAFDFQKIWAMLDTEGPHEDNGANEAALPGTASEPAFSAEQSQAAYVVAPTPSPAEKAQPLPPEKAAIPNGNLNLTNVSAVLNSLTQIDGALGCVLADYNSGMMVAKAGGGVDLEIAAAGNIEVVRAKMKTMSALGLKDAIEDILITLGEQYHIIRPVLSNPGLFIYIVFDKSKSNLAMARFKLLEAEKSLFA